MAPLEEEIEKLDLKSNQLTTPKKKEDEGTE